MTEKKKKPTEIKVKEHFKNLCFQYGFIETEIVSHRRDAALVDQRQIIAKELTKLGYSYPMIGWIMDRDHTSIHHLVKKRGKIEKQES